jgi:hypothetical protein
MVMLDTEKENQDFSRESTDRCLVLVLKFLQQCRKHVQGHVLKTGVGVLYFDASLINPPERRSNFDILKCMLTFR